MKNRHRFVEPQFARDRRNRSCLLALGVTKLSAEVLLNDCVLPLPATLSDTYWQHFTPFIAAIADTTISAATLKQRKIAADGSRALRKACELYDHEDRIFVSAFILQRESRFVHDSTKQHRTFWLRMGLRHRADSLINPVDYLQCLQVMKLRLRAENRHMDPHLEQDSREILSPLTAPSSSIQGFGARDWTAIAHESVFLSRTTFNAEPEYRQHTMALAASKQPLLCLSDVISCDHIGICWSQTSFPIHQPTKEVLSKTPSSGQPGIDMVWRHLEQIKDVAQHLKRHQMRDFLADLSLTYQYLQDHLPGNVVSGGPKNSAVWLNLKTLDHNAVLLDDIKSSWHTTEELVLSSAFDAGSMKAVRPGLMRYEKLLRAVGCSSIIYPTIIRPELQLGVSISSALRQLRRDRILTDVQYSTEGKTIHAHRVVLAARSNKCAVQFSGRWNMADMIQYDRSVDPDNFLSYHTLSTIIDYAYEDEINWRAMEVLEDDDAVAKAMKLELLLDLHKGADSWMMPTLASQIEDKILLAGRAFLNVENVIRIRERAGQVRAVAQMCAEFIERNQRTVQKVHPEML
jgi:sacsin